MKQVVRFEAAVVVEAAKIDAKVYSDARDKGMTNNEANAEVNHVKVATQNRVRNITLINLVTGVYYE